MAEATSKLEILVQLRDEATASLRSLSDGLSDLGGDFNFAENAGAALMGTLQALGAGAIIGNSVKAFAESEAQMGRFNALMKTLPPELQAFRDQILSVADDALLKFGFDNEEAALSMAKLLQVTRDGPLTFQAFQAAMDLARFKGIGLEEATRAIILAFQGNTRMLKELGVTVDEHASKATILAAIQKVVNGQAETFSELTAGNIEVLKLLGGEANEALGAQFAPAVNLVTEAIVGWIVAQGGVEELLQKMQPALLAIAAILTGVFLGGVIVATAGMLAMFGPFGLILAAIAALIGASTLMYTLWQLYWPEMQAVLLNALVVMTGPIGLFVKFVLENWQQIKVKFKEMWDESAAYFKEIFNGILTFFTSGIETIKSAIQAVTNAYNSARSAASSAVRSVGKSLPKLAEGGIVTSPTVAMIGEAGAEAVIPLSKLGSMGGGTNISVMLNGDFYTDEETADKFGKAIIRVLQNQLNLGGVRA